MSVSECESESLTKSLSLNMKVMDLDLEKKESLLEELINLESQVWVTATEKERFLRNRKSFCKY